MTTPQRLGLVALAVVIAAVAYVLLSPTDEEPQEAQKPPSAQQSARSAPEARPSGQRVAVVRLEDGKPVGGARTLRFRSGETARILVRSDAPAEVHLHGYDLEGEVAPGKPARLTFKADLEGIFELEDHETNAELASVEVSPR